MQAVIAQINWRFVWRIGARATFGAAMAVTGMLLLAPFAGSERYALIAVAGYMAVRGAERLFGALSSRPDEWSAKELALLRQLAGAGWVVLPAGDGGYMAYGPNNQQQWIDHWQEVEELAITEDATC